MDTQHSLAYFYQPFVHRQWIRSLGWFEWLINTPSHHRVHHVFNTDYIDNNYGDILIIWDRLFGTSGKGQEPVKFGVTRQIDPQNVPNILLHEFIAIVLIVYSNEQKRFFTECNDRDSGPYPCPGNAVRLYVCA